MQRFERFDRGERGVAAKIATLAVLLLAGCQSAPVAAQPAQRAEVCNQTPFYPDADAYDPGVPTPESVTGHAIGDGAVRYEPMVRYLRALAEASSFVTLTPYAESHEGYTLYYVTITSRTNHERLAAIKTDNAKLADPRTLANEAEAKRILDTLPGVAWMAYCIHGDELSSTDAAVQLAYQLAAGTDAATQRWRDELVVHIDPLMNPDGRERYLGQLRHLTGKVPNPDYQALQHRGLWSAGRGNHYLFDLNRDWLIQAHPETRGRAARMLDWNPHLVVDSHEMWATDTYLFDPPREPLNLALSAQNMAWRRQFSADQARAFDRYGWSYYTQEWYEEWYPGYTNAWASFLGAIGILYEQAGVNAASVKRPTGEVLTYHEAVHHHFVSSLANLETLRANRREILADYLADRQWAISEDTPGPRAFLLPPPKDRSRFDRFLEVLRRQGIEGHLATEPFRAEGVVDVWGERAASRMLPAGTLVVRTAQPHRRLLQALLAFDPHMTDDFLVEERKELENHRGSRIYDVTAWNLGMAYGLEAYWAEGIAEVPLGPARPAAPDDTPAKLTAAAYGYLIDGDDGGIYRAIVRLLDRECQVRVAMKPFRIAGRWYERGAVLLRNHENPDNLEALLVESVSGLMLDVQPVDTALSEDGPDLGGQRFRLLRQPRIAIASQWPIAPTSFASTWYLLDARMELRTSPINLQTITRIDLRKYNVLVFPDTWSAEGLAGILDDKARRKLKTWVEAGGSLVALGRSAAVLAKKEYAMTGTRLKRDVLDQLAVYEEALARERDAREVKLDPAVVWGMDGGSIDEQEQPAAPRPGQPAVAKPDIEALKRKDAWQRIFKPVGAFAAATLDPEHWLCFGLDDRLPVLISTDLAYMSRHPVATPVRLTDSAHLRLSGLLWPEARERWGGTAYTTVERIGHGQIILFASDPFFRGYLEGSGRILLNALILGPGLGTSPPMPW